MFTRIIINLFLLSYWSAQCVNSQFVSFQQPPASSNVCAGQSNTSLVEHFFNLIFSEFHNHPPVCVCVQMCEEQPTYCYPNGCFKKEAPIRKRSSFSPTSFPSTAQVSQVQQDKDQPMSFLVDGRNDFMDNLLNIKSPESKTASKYEDGNYYNELHRDPFKDRYQSIFKYRKTPKVHLRYNLREQVKHKKTDLIKIEKIDVSKTRWPITVNENKQYYLEKGKENKGRYFHSIDNPHSHYQSKYFKRDLNRKITAKDIDSDDLDNTTESASFSLENLIENLIESSFGPLGNDTELDLNVNLDYSLLNNATTVEPITIPYKKSVVKKNTLLDKNSLIILNETTNIISMNNTNENTEENKYHEDEPKNQGYKNVFNDMIASFSKHIEKNNNSSIEMMEHVLGHRVNEDPPSTKATPDAAVESTTTEEIQTGVSDVVSILETIEVNTIETTTELTTGPLQQESLERKEKSIRELEKEQINVMRKSHRRLMRKSYNNKPN